MPDTSVDGRSAIVCGGSRGIGREVALALGRAGARVVVNGRSAEPARAVAEQIESCGGRAIPHPGSVADFDVARELVEHCVDAFGGVDILVNCAGTAEPEGSSILDLSAQDWQALIDSHLTSTFNTCRHAAPRMLAQGRGSIINTSSHAYLGIYGGTGYPAGKGGTNSLTLAIAAELREHGVRCNAVCPGARTRLSSGSAYEAKIHDLHARGILADAFLASSLTPPEPEHVAPLYVFLASERAADITGQLFSASGGYVGVRDLGGESLLGFRNVERDGPWPVEELAEQVLEKLVTTGRSAAGE